MHILKNEIELGFYYPSFFVLESTQDSLENGRLENISPTLFHEYIHFLQDVFCTVGRYNLVHFYNTIKLLQHYMDSAGEGILPVPRDIFSQEENYIRYRDYQNYIHGSSNLFLESTASDVKLQGIETESVEVTDDVCLKAIKLRMSDSTKGNFDFLLGSNAIQESMAALCEKYAYGDRTDNSHRILFPYNVAYLIADHCGAKSLTEGLLMLIAICDVSLMTLTPGLVFMDLINAHATCHFNNYDDVYRYATDNLDVFNDHDTKTAFEDSEQNCRDVFQRHRNDKDISSWGENVLRKAQEKRQQDPTYLVKTLETYGTGAWNHFQNYIGLPIVIDNCGHYFTDTKHDLFAYASLVPFYECIYHGQRQCSLAKVCDRRGYKDNRCEWKPWSRANDDELCPVAHWFVRFGMRGKKIVFDGSG